MTAHILPESRCPRCGKALDRASNITGSEEPEEGDVTVCIGCGGVHVFNKDLNLVIPSEEDMEFISSSPEVQQTVALVKKEAGSV